MCYTGKAKIPKIHGVDRRLQGMCTGLHVYAHGKLFGRDNSNFALLALDATDTLMGMAVCTLVAEWGLLEVPEGMRAVYVEVMCASPSMGIGSLLMNNIEAVARSVGADVVVLRSVLGAVRRYRDWGFQRGAGTAINSSTARNRFRDYFDGVGKNLSLNQTWVNELNGMLFKMNQADALVAMWKVPRSGPRVAPPAPVNWTRLKWDASGRAAYMGSFTRKVVTTLRTYTRIGRDWVMRPA